MYYTCTVHVAAIRHLTNLNTERVWNEYVFAFSLVSRRRNVVNHQLRTRVSFLFGHSGSIAVYLRNVRLAEERVC